MSGDELIAKHRDKFSRFPAGSLFVEVGSDRGSGSSSKLARICREFGFAFKTVDADQQTAAAVDGLVKDVDPSYEGLCSPGEEYLDSMESVPSIVYLDAFDLETVADVPRTAWCQSPRATYARRNVDLTNENCWKMHYDCAVALVKKMPVGGFLFFDDVYSGAPDWDGKGKTAIPFLLANGFELVELSSASVFLERTS